MSKDASVQVEEHKGFCNHWSSYRLSLRQTWRELKLRPRSSINWMIDIFAGTSTDPKADFTFCLNAGFYLETFNMALVYAVSSYVLIALECHEATTTPVSNDDLEEGDELGWIHRDRWCYFKANVGFRLAVWVMATYSLLTLCWAVLIYGLTVVSNYFSCYLLYSGVVMSKNSCVLSCSKMYLLLILVKVLGYVLVDPVPDDKRNLKSMSKFTFPGDVVNELDKALYAKWACLILHLMMIKCAFHIHANDKEAVVAETETLLPRQSKHEV